MNEDVCELFESGARFYLPNFTGICYCKSEHDLYLRDVWDYPLYDRK
jgi:hypothetical protein